MHANTLGRYETVLDFGVFQKKAQHFPKILWIMEKYDMKMLLSYY